MGKAARELEAKLAKMIFDHGALITHRGIDGAGHNVIKYQMGGEQRSIHYALTPRQGGRTAKNTITRLRRDLRELIKIVPPEQRHHEKPKAKPELIQPEHVPTPPKKRITAERKKEMLKAYLSMDSIEEFMQTYDLSLSAAQVMILGQKGQATEKYRKECARARMSQPCQQEAPLRVAEPAAQEDEESQRKEYPSKGMTHEQVRSRNRRIQVYCAYGLSRAEAAAMFDLSLSRVHQICQEEIHVG